MDKEQVKEILIQHIQSVQGCKMSELVAGVSEQLYHHNAMNYDLVLLIAELIKEKRVIEIEYVLPHLSYRTKSFLLPVGTKITL